MPISVDTVVAGEGEIVTRIGKGAPLTVQEEDNNFKNLASFANGLETRMNGSLDLSGNLLSGAVTPLALTNSMGQLVDNQTIAFAGSTLAGQLTFANNPGNNDTLTLTINGNVVTVTFVSALAGTAGSVLIGNNGQATAENLVGLLNNPSVNSTTQLAFSVGNQTYVGYLTATQNAAVVSISAAAGGGLASLTVAVGTAGNTWVWNQPGQLSVKPGSIGPTQLAANVIPSMLYGSVNLTASNNGQSQVNLSADALVLKNASGQVYVASNVSVTANITVLGTAGGLDTGVEAANTWYYVWVIWNGTTLAGLLSVSSTAPTLPTGYTYKALVGVVRNYNDSNFLPFKQYGRKFWMPDTYNVLTTGSSGSESGLSWAPAKPERGLGSLAGTNWSISDWVPPIAKTVQGNMGRTSGSGGIAVAPSSDCIGASVFHCGSAGDKLGGYTPPWTCSCPYNVPLETAQTIWYMTSSQSGTTYGLNSSTDYWCITVTGYEI